MYWCVRLPAHVSDVFVCACVCLCVCVCVCKSVYARSLTVFPRTSFATEGSPQLWTCCQTQPAGQGLAYHSQLYGRRDSTLEGYYWWAHTTAHLSQPLLLHCKHTCTQVVPIHTHVCTNTHKHTHTTHTHTHTPHTHTHHTHCMHVHTHIYHTNVCTRAHTH